MKTKIVIEVKDGIVVFIGSNTEYIDITVIDHDIKYGPGKEERYPDSIMTNQALDDYINES